MAMAAGRLLPAACLPGPKAVTKPSLSGAGAGGSQGGRWGKSSPSHTPNLLGSAAWGRGGEAAGSGNTDRKRVRSDRGVDGWQRRNEAPPGVRMAGQLVPEGARSGKLGGRLGDEGPC